MRRLARAAACALMVMTPPSTSAAVADESTKLWRLDCGRFDVAADAFSDTFAYGEKRMELVGSCYLIKHRGRFLLWDAGLPLALIGQPLDPRQALSGTLDVSIADQLKQIGVRADQIELLAISHNHSDHVGQAEAFSAATLLMGKADFDALRKPDPPFGADPGPLRPWLDGAREVTAVEGDYDIFGDQQVVMLRLPGHTAGHYGLLIRLATGSILLSGDAVHFEAQIARRGVPPFNVDRADTLASLERLQAIAASRNAILIVPHDSNDIHKLPRFPASRQ
ncbi:hypothetical protein ASE06_07030 [Sphingopyxis sp. Root214]|nr:hypothetical protein ASD73_00965 [Sphingopyxis sp. Root154]KRC09866.1 hypothetical protein ASE06_07030 [Sphingopyxis sp. Root214]